MLHLFRSLGGPRGGEGSPSPLEHFGNVRIARAAGLEIVQATAHRRNCVQGIRDRLTSMTRPQKDDLIDRVLARLALLIFDLPLDPSTPPPERFGLLDHLLRVACQTARELTGPGFQLSAQPSVRHREGPPWAYAGVIAAIGHKIGKALDFDLVVPGTAAPWDPRQEPLRLFCERNGIPGTSPEHWRVRPGRGWEARGDPHPDLLRKVITPEVEGYLGPRLTPVLEALSPDGSGRPASSVTPTAHEVVSVARRIDRAVSIEVHGSRPPNARGIQAVPPPRPFEDSGPGSRTTSAPDFLSAPGPGGGPLTLPIPDLDPPDPPDFLPAPIPAPGNRRGDSFETARRMDHELGPARFPETIRRMIVARRLARNGLYSPVYLRPDYLWIIVPEAFERVAPIIGVPYDTESVDRMCASLRMCPGAVPGRTGSGTEFVKTRSDGPSRRAICLRTRDFLGEPEARALGFHEGEIRVWSPLARWEVPPGGSG
jgi:hypothetical protein